MNNEHSKEYVVAIIAAYNPNFELVENVKALKRQVQTIIVVDDGSNDAARPILDEVASTGATVVFQASNAGIAAALNTGISSAQAC